MLEEFGLVYNFNDSWVVLYDLVSVGCLWLCVHLDYWNSQCVLEYVES